MAVAMQGAEAASTLAEASEEMCFCRLCGLMRPAATCRMHGKAWECTQRESAFRSIRRNLGEQPQEMETFSKEETHQFFRELARLKGQDKRIQWTTVRSALVTSMTTCSRRSWKASFCRSLSGRSRATAKRSWSVALASGATLCR